MKLDPNLRLPAKLHARGAALKVGTLHNQAIEKLANVELLVQRNGVLQAKGAVRSTHEFDLALEAPEAQLEAYKKRLEKEKEQLVKNIANSRRQLSDETFMSKAPEKVIEGLRQKLTEYESQLDKTDGALGGLAG